MIKYISYLFYALLSVFAFASCAQHEGTEPGNDGSPKVTVYTFKPGAPYNADNDLQLRLATNSQTSEVYYLAELASQKETNVASMGEYGYMDYVVEKGKKVEGLGGNSSADIVVTDMIGTYSITIVAVNGVIKQQPPYPSWVSNGMPSEKELIIPQCSRSKLRFRYTKQLMLIGTNSRHCLKKARTWSSRWTEPMLL